MDTVSLITDVDEGDWKTLLGSSVLFSAATLFVANLLDQRTYHDYRSSLLSISVLNFISPSPH
jgi:hypothetical protein